MLSAVGYTAPQTCAAIRAGVAMFSELGGIVGRTGEAVVAARLPEGIRDDPMDKVIERVCVAVCAEALARLSEEELGSLPIKIWMCLKDKARPGIVLSAQPLLQQLIDRLSLHRSTTMTVIEAGNAGGLKAIHEIALQAHRAPTSLSLICGFDLLTDIHCLAYFEKQDRLKGSYQPRGLIPGEACACVAVEPLAAAKDAGRNVFCNIQGTGYSEETATVVSEKSCLGSGLTTAIRSALQSAGWAGDAVDGVYCDLNGEPYRAHEWMLALCRALAEPGSHASGRLHRRYWGGLRTAADRFCGDGTRPGIRRGPECSRVLLIGMRGTRGTLSFPCEGTRVRGMDVNHKSPFQAALVPIIDKDGSEARVAILKATYDILSDGSLRIADQQKPPVFQDIFAGEPGQSTTLYESDGAFFKPSTDIVVVGTACAPGGKPTESFQVGLAVGGLRKIVTVTGDRRWLRSKGRSAAISEPEPLTEMPLVWEKAFGGADTTHGGPTKHDFDRRNPIGTGFRLTDTPGCLDGVPLPNLEYPDALIKHWHDRPGPASFGFVGRHWHPRIALAGTYDEKWQKARLPLLPEDFDYRFFNSAPADQRYSKFFRGGEVVRAVNFSKRGREQFTIPTLTVFFCGFAKKQRFEVEARLDTVIFEFDKEIIMLIWRTKYDVLMTEPADEVNATVIFH